MILMIDHDDSFTYNLVHMLEDLDEEVITISHTDISFNYFNNFIPDYVILSPGPGHPKEHAVSKKVIDMFKGKIPILGVCLGFQMIYEYFGGCIIEANRPMHGMTDDVLHDGLSIYNNLENPIQVTRYHSLIADPESKPDELIVTGKTNQYEIMSIRHTKDPIEGVQFHPEAILTSSGQTMLHNFIKTYREWNK
ncbi:anthranilate synthase component II [Piscibacillus salipiscarius]|uniref:Anthranilate synthase component II n=1 Tax=Piscibacillus salipiscarius TaxID=299480 RepID=A0ABW5QDL7_9BACI|nr:aminodeoxychorismate/anthranilate synthase component II [Piscibacillus salipiscarius]